MLWVHMNNNGKIGGRPVVHKLLYVTLIFKKGGGGERYD